MTLAEITCDKWHVVAKRVRVSADTDGWSWLLPDHEREQLDAALATGAAVTAHSRDELGHPVIKAKLWREGR